MDNNLSIEEVFKYLATSTEFIGTLTEVFTDKEIPDVIRIMIGEFVNNENLEARVYDVLTTMLNDDAKVILSICYDSSGWGPGGNGCFLYSLFYGILIVKADSIEEYYVFDKEPFYPKYPDFPLTNDIIEIDSDYFPEETLFAWAFNIFDHECFPSISINDVEYYYDMELEKLIKK